MKVNGKQKLNAFEMKCLKCMAGVSWLDRIRNEVVRVRTGVRRELATCRYEFFGMVWPCSEDG